MAKYNIRNWQKISTLRRQEPQLASINAPKKPGIENTYCVVQKYLLCCSYHLVFKSLLFCYCSVKRRSSPVWWLPSTGPRTIAGEGSQYVALALKFSPYPGCQDTSLRAITRPPNQPGNRGPLRGMAVADNVGGRRVPRGIRRLSVTTRSVQSVYQSTNVHR